MIHTRILHQIDHHLVEHYMQSRAQMTALQYGLRQSMKTHLYDELVTMGQLEIRCMADAILKLNAKSPSTEIKLFNMLYERGRYRIL